MKKLFTFRAADLAPVVGKFAPPSSSIPKALPQRYSTSQDEPDSADVLGKARSTAEEFLRQANEKSESLKDAVGEMAENAKEAVVGDDEGDKEKFKERVEKGLFDHPN